MPFSWKSSFANFTFIFLKFWLSVKEFDLSFLVVITRISYLCDKIVKKSENIIKLLSDNSVKSEENSLIISVHDDGPGIDQTQYEEVLQPFSRLDPSRNQNKGSGVGLGLPIAKEIVEAHGGILKLSKSSILSGLSVSLVIPVN